MTSPVLSVKDLRVNFPSEAGSVSAVRGVDFDLYPGRTLGIVGYGNIGAQLSVVAEAFGMHVSFYDLEDKLPLGNATKCTSLDELLETCETITLHVDGRAGNAGTFGAEQFGRVQRVPDIDAALLQRHRYVLGLLGLPTSYSGASFDELLTALRRDKKTRGATLRFVVLDALAEPTRLVAPDDSLLREAYAALA